MRHAPRHHWLPLLLGGIAIFSAVLMGLSLRLDDPLATGALPAEDPYTHMSLVREHLHDGTLDASNDGNLYPPGMHALVAAVWVYTGMDLLDLMRLGPAVLGAIGILGMGLFLWRMIGPAGAVVGAWAYAMVPEVIFRTTMMAPTALDLALLPFLFFAYLELARGRFGWFAVAALVTLYLVFAHPWVLLVLGLAGLLFLILCITMPWPAARAPPLSAIGTTGLIALFGSGVAGALLMGSAEALDLPMNMSLDAFAPFLMVASFLPLTFALAAPKAAKWLLPWWGEWRGAVWVATILHMGLIAVVAFVTWMALQIGMPEHVRLQGMIGWPILLVAAFALIALPIVRGPAAHMGTALFLATYPFVVLNVFHSDFWPHRTAVFLALALVILAGVTAWSLQHPIRRLVEKTSPGPSRPVTPDPAASHAGQDRPTRAADTDPHVVTTMAAGFTRPGAPTRRRPEPRRRTRKTTTRTARQQPRPHGVRFAPAASTWAVVLPLLFIGIPLAGAVAVTAPEPYDGWYRLFDECDHEALERVAAFANQDPDAIVIAGTWQAKLVVAGFTQNASRVWYAQHVFTNEQSRDDLLQWPANDPFPLYVVVDPHLQEEIPDVNLSFLKYPTWRTVAMGCHTDGQAEGVVAYRYHPEPFTEPGG